jgi:hypothetical protein
MVTTNQLNHLLLNGVIDQLAIYGLLPKGR